jgi:hypothetical protein
MEGGGVDITNLKEKISLDDFKSVFEFLKVYRYKQKKKLRFGVASMHQSVTSPSKVEKTEDEKTSNGAGSNISPNGILQRLFIQFDNKPTSINPD